MIAALAACGSSSGSAAESASFGKPAEPFGLLAQVKFGMPSAEVARMQFTVRGEEATARDGAHRYTLKLPVQRERAVTQMAVAVEGDVASLVGAWGPGTAGTTRDPFGKNWRYYFNAERSIRAEVYENTDGKRFTVTFVPIVPLAKVFASDPAKVADVDLLGRAPDAVQADARARGHRAKSDEISITRSEWQPFGSTIRYRVGDGVVGEYSLHLYTSLAATARTEVLETLRSKWGAPTAEDDLGSKVSVYRASNPRVLVRDGDDGMTLEVSR